MSVSEIKKMSILDIVEKNIPTPDDLDVIKDIIYITQNVTVNDFHEVLLKIDRSNAFMLTLVGWIYHNNTNTEWCKIHDVTRDASSLEYFKLAAKSCKIAQYEMSLTFRGTNLDLKRAYLVKSCSSELHKIPYAISYNELGCMESNSSKKLEYFMKACDCPQPFIYAQNNISLMFQNIPVSKYRDVLKCLKKDAFPTKFRSQDSIIQSTIKRIEKELGINSNEKEEPPLETKFKVFKANIAKIQTENSDLKRKNTEIENENTELKRQLKEMQDLIESVCGEFFN